MFQSAQVYYADFYHLDVFDQFVYLMSNQQKHVIKFLSRAMPKRTDYLYNCISWMSCGRFCNSSNTFDYVIEPIRNYISKMHIKAFKSPFTSFDFPLYSMYLIYCWYSRISPMWAGWCVFVNVLLLLYQKKSLWLSNKIYLSIYIIYI